MTVCEKDAYLSIADGRSECGSVCVDSSTFSSNFMNKAPSHQPIDTGAIATKKGKGGFLLLRRLIPKILL